MIWSSFSDFIHMNGYGPYVWGSFIVTFILFYVEQRSLKLFRKKIISSEQS